MVCRNFGDTPPLAHLENQTPAATWTLVGDALPGAAVLTGSGDLSASSSNVVTLAHAAPSAPAGVFVGLAGSPTRFKGGTLLPVPWLLFEALTTAPSGGGTIPFTMPPGVGSGTELWLQYALQDAGAPFGGALSNAPRAVTP